MWEFYTSNIGIECSEYVGNMNNHICVQARTYFRNIHISYIISDAK